MKAIRPWYSRNDYSARESGDRDYASRCKDDAGSSQLPDCLTCIHLRLGCRFVEITRISVQFWDSSARLWGSAESDKCQESTMDRYMISRLGFAPI